MRITEITEKNRGWSGLQSVYPISQSEFEGIIDYLLLLKDKSPLTVSASMPVIEEFMSRIDKFLSVSWPDEDDKHVEILRESMQHMRDTVNDLVSKL